MARGWNNHRNRGSYNYRTRVNNTGGRSQNGMDGRPSREGGAGGGAWELYNRLRALRLGSEQNGERPSWQQHSAQGRASDGVRHQTQDQGVAVSSASHHQRHHTGEGSCDNGASDNSSTLLSRRGSQQRDAPNSRIEPQPAASDACTGRTRARQSQSRGDTRLDSLLDDVAETVAAERHLQFQMRVASHDTDSWDRSMQLLRYLRTNRPKKKRHAISDDLLRRDGEADATAMAPRESEPPAKRGATVEWPSPGVPWSVQGRRFWSWNGWHWDDELQMPFIPAGGTYLADDCPSLCWPEWAQYWHDRSMMHSACASGLDAAAETLAEEGTSVSGGQEAASKSVIDSASDSEGAPGFWYY